ncbi:hypothetical protein BGZ50_009504 [Haplosporangium sp. Z 11]|nr:hypothetical protein BGZ50_009504 [Haplosporangium sp. Z 11]
MKSQDPSIVHLGQEMRRQWSTDKIAVQNYWNENELVGIREKNISKAARRASKLDNAAGEYQLKKSLLKLREGTEFPPSTTPQGSPSHSGSTATTSETSSTFHDPLILADPTIAVSPTFSGTSASSLWTPTSPSIASTSSSSASALSTSSLISMPELNVAKEGTASSIVHPVMGAALDLPEAAACDKASTAALKRKAGTDDAANSSAKDHKRSSTDEDVLVNSGEIEELISRIKFTKHQECDTSIASVWDA